MSIDMNKINKAMKQVMDNSPANTKKSLYKEMEFYNDGKYRVNGFTGERNHWSRNFGVDGLDSDGSNLANYVVRISRNDIETDDGHVWGNNFITALMTNAVSYNLNAGWDVSNNQVSSMMQGAASGILGKAAQFGGLEMDSTGYMTRKIYRGGTDMSLNINFRLFDSTSNFTSESTNSTDTTVDPNLTVMDGVKWLNSIMIPSNIASLTLKQVEKFTADLVKGEETEKEKEDSAKQEEINKKKLKKAKDALTSTATGRTIQNGLDVVTNTFNRELGQAELNLTSTPPPVSVLIGKWLYIDRAVVTDASFVFSEEMSAKGPLYCDVTLQVSTQENLMMIADANGDKTDINRLKLFNAPNL